MGVSVVAMPQLRSKSRWQLHVIFAAAVLGSIVAISGQKTKPDFTQQLTDSDFAANVGKSKAVLVDFYLKYELLVCMPILQRGHSISVTRASNCKHCVLLKPHIESLAQKYQNSPLLTVASVDAYQQATNDKFNVQSYPTLLFFGPNSARAEKYEGTSLL